MRADGQQHRKGFLFGLRFKGTKSDSETAATAQNLQADLRSPNANMAQDSLSLVRVKGGEVEATSGGNEKMFYSNGT